MCGKGSIHLHRNFAYTANDLIEPSNLVCFKERLTRCSQACQDVFKDSLSSSGEPTPHQIEKAQTKAEQCIVQCADTHIPLIPKLIAKFKFSASCYLN